jgi:hypothetical protein
VTSTEILPSRLIGVADRVPGSLGSLAGPENGVVVLPVRLAWSGPKTFDVTDPKERLTLYRTLLDCGQREDIVRYVNAELIVHDWPRIRRLTARRVIAVWESQLPDLASAA